MAADAGSGTPAYVERMQRTLWPLVRKYWFDAGVIALAIGGAFELAAKPAWRGRARIEKP
jgi:hypothetical protein